MYDCPASPYEVYFPRLFEDGTVTGCAEFVSLFPNIVRLCPDHYGTIARIP